MHASSARTLIPLEKVKSIEDLHPNPLQYDRLALMEHVRRYDRETLRQHYAKQPIEGAEVYANYVVNLWEYEHGVEHLTSRPWNITIPMTDVCNAKCTFCIAPLVPQPQALTVEEVSHFSEALRYALRVSLQGLGEPLAHPHFEAIAEEIRKHMNQVALLEMITNGWLLSGRRWELLKAIRISDLQVSVNAATDQTHQVAMGSRPGTLDQVVRNIQAILADPGWPRHLKLSMVVTRHSLPEVVPFLDMFMDMGVESFQLNTLNSLTHPDWGWGHKNQYVDLWCGHLPNARELVETAAKTIEGYRQVGIQITANPEQWLSPLEHGVPLLVDGSANMLMPHEGQAELTETRDATRGVRFAGTALCATNGYLLRSPSLRITPGRYRVEIDMDIEAGRASVALVDVERDTVIVEQELRSGRNVMEHEVHHVMYAAIVIRRGPGPAPVILQRSASIQPLSSQGPITCATPPPRPITASPLPHRSESTTCEPAHALPAPHARRIYCPMVYNTLSVFDHSLHVSICCYMGNAPGHRKPRMTHGSLLDAYNDQALRLVRRSLTSEKHLPICDTCKYGAFRSY